MTRSNARSSPRRSTTGRVEWEQLLTKHRLHSPLAERGQHGERVIVEVDAVLQVDALQLDQLVDQRLVERDAGRAQDRRHVAIHAAELADAPGRTRLLERLLEPDGLHAVADPFGDRVAQTEPFAPHDRVVEIEQHGGVGFRHAA